MDRSRLCVRPDCAAAAAAVLTYDYDARRVWLDALGGPQLGAWGLCPVHADSLRAPNGWVRVDRRRAVPPEARETPEPAARAGHEPEGARPS